MDGYANAYDTGVSQTGLTNQWLESRQNIYLFSQRYGDFPHAMKGSNTMHFDLLRTQMEESDLSRAFFSEGNVQLLKQQLADGVKEKSKGMYVISPEAQSTESMMTIMTSIFLDNARHLPNDVAGQVQDLNRLVLNDIVPRVMTNIQMELTHRRDRCQQPLTMDRALNVSRAGTRSNQSVTTTFL